MSDKTLRSKLIRLAHAKPELRQHLLPLLSDKVACGCDDPDHQHDLEFAGYLADDKLGKQMHDVKEKANPNIAKGKADKQRDPYARSLAQGQFQSKIMNPDKRQKIRDKFKD